MQDPRSLRALPCRLSQFHSKHRLLGGCPSAEGELCPSATDCGKDSRSHFKPRLLIFSSLFTSRVFRPPICIFRHAQFQGGQTPGFKIAIYCHFPQRFGMRGWGSDFTPTPIPRKFNGNVSETEEFSGKCCCLIRIQRAQQVQGLEMCHIVSLFRRFRVSS